jgi:hypothetical protein
MTKDLKRTDAGPGIDESMVAVFSSSNHDAEMEAAAIQGVLESNEIPAMIVGSHMIPSLEVQVQVPEHMLAQARQAIRDARDGGRQAASEAEAETEE